MSVAIEDFKLTLKLPKDDDKLIVDSQDRLKIPSVYVKAAKLETCKNISVNVYLNKIEIVGT